jgi:hypothetical protein
MAGDGALFDIVNRIVTGTDACLWRDCWPGFGEINDVCTIKCVLACSGTTEGGTGDVGALMTQRAVMPPEKVENRNWVRSPDFFTFRMKSMASNPGFFVVTPLMGRDTRCNLRGCCVRHYESPVGCDVAQK